MAAVERLVDLYCRLLKLVIALFLAAMVVLVFTNVTLRYAFNSGIPTSEELSRWLGSWKQAVLTFGDSAPASGISVGLFFYSSGLVFGISAAVILLLDLVRVLSGQASEDDLISVKEGE
jgi:TRAP-type transport system small permease protein